MLRYKSQIINKTAVNLLMFFLCSIVFPFYPGKAWAGSSFDGIYETICDNYPDQIASMKSLGVTDGEIKSFINAFETELKRNNNQLTDDNFKDAMADTVFSLYMSSDYDKVFEAAFEVWGLSEAELLEAFLSGNGINSVIKKLPPIILDIGKLVKDAMIDPSDEPDNDKGSGPGGGSGAGGDQSTDEENGTPRDQLEGGTEEIPLTFVDIVGHWAQTEIEFLAAQGIINGVSKTSFEPNRHITRAEFAAILVNALEIPQKEVEKKFTDVPAETWYADSVYRAYSVGLARGISQTIFGPKQNITRQEMAAMAVNALTWAGKSTSVSDQEVILSSFSDYDQIAPWAEKAIEIAMKNKIITGRSEKVLAPRDATTRAEAAVIVKRLLAMLD